MQKNTNINFDDKPRKVRPSSSACASSSSRPGSRSSYHSSLNSNSRLLHTKRNKYLLTGAITFSLAFISAYVASAGFMSPSDSDASTSVNASISSDGYYINVTSLGEVNINVDATQDSATAYASDTVTVNTNTKGYKLYLSTASDDTNGNRMYLNGDSNSIYYLSPISGYKYSIANLETNSWGYTTSSNPTNGSYYPVPVKGNEALLTDKWNSLTAGTDTTDTHTVTYGIKADMGLPAGRYSNTVTYSVIAEANSVSNVASIYPNEVTKESSGTFTLTVTIPMMTNMDYGDWTVKVGSSDCTGVSASKNDNKLLLTCTTPKNLTIGSKTVTATSSKYGTYTATNALTYNPKAASGAVGIYTINNMQDMSSSICSQNTTPSASATLFDTDGSHQGDSNYVPQWFLKDTRDSKVYVVQKMPDGKCWMVQNLAVDSQTLTSEKSNVSSDYSLATPYYTHTHTDGNTSSKGNLYSPTQATANALSCSSQEPSNVHASADICPKNWRLPNGGSSNEFATLYGKYSNKSQFDTQWHTVYAGYYDSYIGNTLKDDGLSGFWWSRTRGEVTGAGYKAPYYMSISRYGSVTTNGDNGFYTYTSSHSVRCIAQ